MTEMKSFRQFSDIILGARLDDQLWILLQDAYCRTLLRTALIQTYFSPDIHTMLLEQTMIHHEAFVYSTTLLEKLGGKVREELSIPLQTAVRDQGFRRAIVIAYNHRCAQCGISIRTPEGHSAIDAAHIRPWSMSQNDDPRNGLALCKLCHWVFDEGLTSISATYTILLSSYLTSVPNMSGHLSTLADRSLFLPSDVRLHPDHDALRWHRQERFRRE